MLAATGVEQLARPEQGRGNPEEDRHSRAPERPPIASVHPADAAALKAFVRFDAQGAGLTHRDLKALLMCADYDATDEYVDGILALWDTDGSGTMELREFIELWEHLDLDHVAEQLVAPGRGAAEFDVVVAAFDRFNLNGDGMLEMEEIRQMMESTFMVDTPYVVGLADLFGKYDEDGSGGVELPEVSSQVIRWLLVIYRCSLSDSLRL